MVVKANFVRLSGPRGMNATGVAKAFASANYMMFRPGEDGGHRQAYDGQQLLNPSDVHTVLGKGCKEFSYAYRMVLSPERNFGAETTQEWAARTLAAAGYERFLVVSHAGEKGHTAHPHAHALVFTSEKMTRDDFRHLRVCGDVQAKVLEMRLGHDRHMKEALWRMQQEQSARAVEAKREVSSQGVEDSGNTRKEERAEATTRRREAQLDMEM